MFYALVFICMPGAVLCDVEHAFYARQSAPVFDSEDECLEGVKDHVTHVWRSLKLREGEQYPISISCEAALGPPA